MVTIWIQNLQSQTLKLNCRDGVCWVFTVDLIYPFVFPLFLESSESAAVKKMVANSEQLTPVMLLTYHNDTNVDLFSTVMQDVFHFLYILLIF